MAEIWAAAIAAGAAVAGTAVAYKGAQDQKKANANAQQQNQSQFDNSQNQNWINYLLTRGINPGSNPVETGKIPTSGYTAVNTKLPLWMNLSGGSTPGKAFDYKFSNAPITGTQPMNTTSSAAVTGGGGGSSTSSKLKTAGAVVGSLFGDPLPGLIKIFG